MATNEIARCAIALLFPLAGCMSSGSPESSARKLDFAAPIVSTISGVVPEGSSIRDLKFADVNSDGRVDVLMVFADRSGQTGFVIFLAQRDGTYTLAATLDAVTRGVQVADFNYDGKPDLFACGVDGPILYLGAGDGRNWTAVHLPSPAGYCESTVVGDFDADGMVDAAFSTYFPGDSHGYLVTLRGKGDGTFESWGSPYTPNEVSVPPGLVDFFGVLTGSFDGDKRTDLLFTVGMGELAIWPKLATSRGDGSFQRLWPNGDYPAEFTRRRAYLPIVTDLNGDGRHDVIVQMLGYQWPLGVPGVPSTGPAPPPGPSPIEVRLLSRADGTYSYAFLETSDSLLAVGDLDGDGRADRISLSYPATSPSPSVGQLLVGLGNGDGTFKDAQAFGTTDTLPVGGGWIRITDFNGDGKPDLISVSSERIYVMLAR